MKIKHLLIIIFSLISLSIFSTETYSDKTTLEMDVSLYEQVLLFNKYGEVKVTGISGSKAYIRVKRTLKARTNQDLEKAKKEIYLDTLNLEGHLYFFIQNPYSILELDEIGEHAYYNSRETDKWRWSNNNKKNIEFDFAFEVQMPMNKAFRVSTHKKDLTVKGMTGKLNAAAHYGDIRLEGVKNLESVHGHHGSIFVNFDTNPNVNGKYHTHHGKIELEFPSAPSADISMSSHHGKFYTDFDWKPNPQIINREKSKKGTKYKIGSSTSVRMGQGKQKMSLKTHHGDMYIRKA